LLQKYQKEGRGKDEAKYYAMIEWFDETCGELLDYIKVKGQEENTLVVYICDNGWKARSQSVMTIPKNWNQGYAPRSKGSPFENGIRTPIMFKLPGEIKAEFSDELASAIDLFPTILAACGIDSPKNLPGVNLLKEKRTILLGAAYAIHNMTVGKPADTRQYRWAITKKWKYMVRDNGQDTTKYKYVHLWDTVPERLYNLQKDPQETLNLSSEFPQVVGEMKAKLEAWLK
jgi:arylsulfatase A-like enzyme